MNTETAEVTRVLPPVDSWTIVLEGESNKLNSFIDRCINVFILLMVQFTNTYLKGYLICPERLIQ